MSVDVKIVPRYINGCRYTDVFFEVTEDGVVEHYYSRNPWVIDDGAQQRNAQAQQFVERKRRYP
jgi:hypothetical protein